MQVIAFDQWGGIFSRVCPKLSVTFGKILSRLQKAKSLLKICGLWSIENPHIGWNSNEELARYFTNSLVLSDYKGILTFKNILFMIKSCRSTKASRVFITVILKVKNAMRLSSVPYNLFFIWTYYSNTTSYFRGNLGTASQT